MKKEEEEVFFNEIEEVLHAHEEAYDEGAWEDFAKNRKKNKRSFLPYRWLAAAAILLLFSFGLFEILKNEQHPEGEALVGNREDKPFQNVDTTIKSDNQELANKENPLDKNRIARLPIDSKPLIKPSSNYSKKAIENQDIPVLFQENPINIAKNSSTNSNQQPENAIAGITNAQNAINSAKVDTTFIAKSTLNKNRPVQVAAGSYDSLVNKKPTIEPSKNKENKVTYSLVVSPSMSNQKVNFGAGMEFAFKLNDRLSINSGLMYATLNAKSEGKSFQTANSVPQSANLAVKGIELPLGLQYQTSGGFYASAGVSALNLINEQLEYSVVEQRTVTHTQISGGVQQEVLLIVSEKKTEKSVEPLSNYMGFFNFSVGKKQAFGNTHLNIGPFVKVPFNNVSSERIKLLQGGVKISFDF